MDKSPDTDHRGQQVRRRRLSPTSLLGFVVIIAIASAIGIVVSLGQRSTPRPVSATNAPDPTPPLVTSTPMPNVPVSGLGFALADDAASHQVMLFGGVGNYGNTWLWDGSTWTLAHPAVSPAGRFGASAAYDPETRTVLLFGGRLEAGTPVHDTWEWNGTTWIDLDSGAGGPQPGEGSDMAWDAASHQMVLVTGSGVISDPGATWVWDGTHWNHPRGAQLPAGAFYSPMSFDPVTDSLIAVACCVGPPPATGAVNSTWRWDGAHWILLPTPSHSPIEGTTMALDPTINRLVLCSCGVSPTTEYELLAWNGTGWTLLSSAPLPFLGGAEVSDSDHHALLLVGPPPATTGSGALPVQVWSLTGSGWHRVGTAG
jgi:hypothetical protein